MVNENDLKHIDFIKVAMMITVVLYHSCMFFTDGWFSYVEPAQKAPFIAIGARYLNTFHVRTFTMASGYLFYALMKDAGKYKNGAIIDFKRRAKRLLLPYFSTILFWVLPFYIFFYGFDKNKIIYKYVLGCSPSQLWFLPMIFEIYVVYYFILKKHTPSDKGLLTSSFISMGGYLLGKILPYNFFQIITALNFSMFYYLGAYLYEKKCKINFVYILLFAGISILAFVVTGIAKDISSFMIRALLILIENFGYYSGVLMIFGISSFIYKRLVNIKLYMFLLRNSFGIYLFHQQLIYIGILLLNGKVPSFVQVILCFLLSITCASIITLVLKSNKSTKVLFGV